MGCFLVTLTFGAVAHLCPGCQPGSDVACSMHPSSSTEEDSYHKPVQSKKMSCCEDSESEQKPSDCELCADVEEPVANGKYSKATPKSKMQLSTITFQAYPSFKNQRLFPEVQYLVELSRSSPSSALIFLKSVRLLC